MVRKKLPAAPKQNQAIDGSFFKDLADVIRAKNIFFVPFFVPFFGAFVAFLVGKSDVVLAGTLFFQIVCALTFAAGIAYASIVSQLLWVLETLRFVTNLEKTSGGAFKPWETTGTSKGSHSKSDLGDQLVRSVGWENRMYRWTMWLLYFMAMNALAEMYLRKTIIDPLLRGVILRLTHQS